MTIASQIGQRRIVYINALAPGRSRRIAARYRIERGSSTQLLIVEIFRDKGKQIIEYVVIIFRFEIQIVGADAKINRTIPRRLKPELLGKLTIFRRTNINRQKRGMGAKLRVRVHAAGSGGARSNWASEEFIINCRRIVENIITYITTIVLRRVIRVLGIGGLRIKLQTI
ncbi:hypothetical protein D3C86_978300 [compost metagenome]